VIEPDDGGAFRPVLRELPRRRLAFLLAVVLANIALVIVLQGQRIREQRLRSGTYYAKARLDGRPCRYCGRMLHTISQSAMCDRRRADRLNRTVGLPFVAPWSWTGDEWQQTVLWK